MEEPQCVEQRAIDAVVDRKFREARDLVRAHPEFDHTWKDNHSRTLFYVSCQKEYTPLINFLLDFEKTPINDRNSYGNSAFMLACISYWHPVIRLLARQARVDVLTTDNDDNDALAWARAQGPNVLDELIASGRDYRQGRTGPDGYQGQFENGFRYWNRFERDPEPMRQEVRLKLRYYEDVASRLFCLVVLMCEKLYTTRRDRAGEDETRFFSIAARLPMELQMMLCHRAVGSMKSCVLNTDFEKALKDLALVL